MKYSVKTHELQWYDCCYVVEADSVEEARNLIESGEGDIQYSDYDTSDQIDIQSVEDFKYFNDEVQFY